jgi:integrase
MASIQRRGDSYYCQFRYGTQRRTFSIGKVTDAEADAWVGKVAHILMRVKQRLLTVPSDCDIVDFILADGRAPTTPLPTGSGERITIGKLRDRYFETHSNGTLEQSTLDGIRLHFKHLVSTLGDRFPVQELTLSDLQKHVDRRAKMAGMNGKLSPATIRKEIVTLRTAWNWAVHMDLVSGRFPNRGLRFPKLDEKPPFQTWTEIERRIAAGGLSLKQAADLWDALYLQPSEISQLLEYVRAKGTQPWVFPYVATAAHTGARRSELLRVGIGDVDFGDNTILINEKKRAKGKRTTRRVAMTAFLRGVLEGWLDEHPGGQKLFCQAVGVVRSRTRRTESTPVTSDEAHDHFKRTTASGKWRVLKGVHALRHSYISALASKGVDQRIIDELVGHVTEEQRRRYRHLLPDVKQRAVSAVFDGV